MSKKFIKVEDGKVTLIHHMPFDQVNGLGKSEQELMTMGALVEDIPEPEKISGKSALPMYDSVQGFYYIYQDIPKTADDRIADLENMLLMERGII